MKLMGLPDCVQLDRVYVVLEHLSDCVQLDKVNVVLELQRNRRYWGWDAGATHNNHSRMDTEAYLPLLG